MPVIEYCAFLVALCLNCLLCCNGVTAIKVTVQHEERGRGCCGECFEPEREEEHFLLHQVCVECEPVSFGHLPVFYTEGDSSLMYSSLRLTPFLQHEQFSSSKHGLLEEDFSA